MPITNPFDFSEEEIALQKLARDFFAQRVQPLTDEIESDSLRHIRDLFSEMGSLGLLGPFLDEKYGGGGARLRTRAIVSEEAARVNAGLDVSMFADIILFARAIAKHGTAAQKEQFLTPVVTGEKIAGMAITEPSGGSNALSPKSRARRVEGGWILDASKTFITNAPVADFIVLIARTSGEDRQIDGGTWFILDRTMKGFETGQVFLKEGWKSSPTGEVFADNVFVPDAQVLGEPGEGFRYMVESLDTERAFVGASATGIAQGCLDVAAEYSDSREVFGQPITRFQLVQEKIAKIASDIELSRTLLYRLLGDIESGHTVTREAAILKMHSTEMATRAALDMIQLLGGAAYVDNNTAVRFLRDAKLHEIGAGTTEIMKVIIARETLRNYRRK